MTRLSARSSAAKTPPLSQSPSLHDFPGTVAPDGLTNVLFVGHSDAVRLQIERICGQLGLAMSATAGPDETLAHLGEGRYPICVLEVGGGGDSTRIVQSIRSQHPRTMVIAVGDPNDREATSEAVRAGAFDVLSRPVQAGELAVLISNAREHLAFMTAQGEIPTGESAPHGVFGMSNVMRDVMRTVQRAAPSRCGVIICGE